MSERDESAGQTAEELTDQVPAAGDVKRDEPGRGELDDYREPGFDPEQRRFLWTITAVLVLALFGSVAVNIIYQERQRSHDVAINRAADEYRMADDAFNQLKQVIPQAMVSALRQGDKASYDREMGRLMNAFETRKRAQATLRREQGLDERTLEQSEDEFAARLESAVKQAVAQSPGQRPTTDRAATQPAGSTTGAAGASGPSAPSTTHPGGTPVP